MPSTRKLHARRTQWAVGQGGFHTGVLGTDANPLGCVWVYDVGSITAGNRLPDEIDLFRRRTAQLFATTEPQPGAVRDIDVLYLSHLDLDHVNGVEHLARVGRIHRIIAPLTTPLERLALLGRTVGTPSAWYLALVADPATTLSGIAAQVVFVKPGTIPETPLAQQLSPSDDGDLTLPPVRPGVRTVSAAAAALPVRAGRQILWVFDVYAAPPTLVPAVESAFRASLATEWAATEAEVGRILRTPADLLARLTARDGQPQLRRAYAAALGAGKLNFTSLSLYAGPAAPVRLSNRSRWPVHLIGRPFRSTWHDRHELAPWQPEVGWVHTGDAELGTRHAAGDLTAAMSWRLPMCGSAVLPHHGSDHNSCAALIGSIPHAHCWVSASQPGFRPTWKHPGPRTTQLVNEAGTALLMVTQVATTRYSDAVAFEM